MGTAPKLTFQPANKITPNINVTPLVDVVLVLLIIFMVIAPSMEAGERVELPGITNVDAKSKLESYTLTVTASGRLMLEKDYLTEDDMVPKLKAAHDQSPDKRLVIKGDKGLRYGRMREVFFKAQSIGFHGVALMVDQKKGADGAPIQE